MKRTLSWLSLLLLFGAASAHAQLYKWVGPNGKVTYSDTPPPPSATQVEKKAAVGVDAGTAGLPYDLAEAVKNSPVTLYSTANCAGCDEGRRMLNNQGIPFTEKTVNTNDDLARLRQAGGDAQLPFLTIGRSKQSGYEHDTWMKVLVAAGYPETNKLPKTYRNPPAQPAAPVVQAATPEPGNPAAGRNASSPIEDVAPAAGNAPPGFRF